ncbi:MAG TPA: hypothetical protein VFN57_18870 [Thermomicrobiaceae bacterium]|nr:hypothetical protein [Thermomicrobiaceae bacterium]
MTLDMAMVDTGARGRAVAHLIERPTVRLGDYLSAHPDLWVQPESDDSPWYTAPEAARRIPAAHLALEVAVSQTASVDAGLLWLDEVSVGYRWARPLRHPNR